MTLFFLPDYSAVLCVGCLSHAPDGAFVIPAERHCSPKGWQKVGTRCERLGGSVPCEKPTEAAQATISTQSDPEVG